MISEYLREFPLPPPDYTPQDTQARTWWLKAHSLPLNGIWFSQDTYLSYPVLDHHKLHFFHYEKSGERYYPISRLTTTFPKVEEVYFFPGTVSELFPGLDQTAVRGGQLDGRYENQLFRALSLLSSRFDEKLASWAGVAYQVAFDQVVPYELRPYYQALNPNFFDWLKQTSC